MVGRSLASILGLERPDIHKQTGHPLNKPRAVVREIDGQLVLDDPDALAMVRAIGKHNCGQLLLENAERMEHFVKRIFERDDSPNNVVITLINADDIHGREIAELLIPGHDWNAYRARGELPLARGLAGRDGINEFLDLFDREAGDKLRKTNGIAIVVIHEGVAEIFTPKDLTKSNSQ